MDPVATVVNEVERDSSGVWRLKGHQTFDYSDGTASEKYLEKVFASASDLSSNSDELQAQIKDWPSEYHLTKKRAQLLSGLTFDRASRVLEVGCGCGAITRYLGETFDSVVSVDGSIQRARLARLRSRDLNTVSILCAPFQKVQFREKFDIIFCIGVLEYSASFIDGEDPYQAAINYFSEMLSADGILVIAIENQFGLKYFNGAREDHLGVRYENLEGYHRFPRKVRTFGRTELARRLQARFSDVRFLYPYPDYKVPDVVLSEEFMRSGRAAEIVSQSRSRDYAAPLRPLWNEAHVGMELSKNGQLSFFANSFLVLASRKELARELFDHQAVLFSSGRRLPYSTRTRIVENGEGVLIAQKRRVASIPEASNPVMLVESDAPWVDGVSLQTVLIQNVFAHDMTLERAFQPVKPWLEYLRSQASERDSGVVLDGAHVDSIWRNAYLVAGRVVLIDREWVWKEPVALNAIVIRAIYDFLSAMEFARPYVLRKLPSRGAAAIRQIAETFGVALTSADFDNFVALESQLSNVATGSPLRSIELPILWFLRDRFSRRLARNWQPLIIALASRIAARYWEILRRT